MIPDGRHRLTDWRAGRQFEFMHRNFNIVLMIFVNKTLKGKIQELRSRLRRSPEDDPVGSFKIRPWRDLSSGMTLAF
jgi:hypothetical protein